MIHRVRSLVLLAIVAALAAGCTAPGTTASTVETLDAERRRVLLMSPDVRMYLITASGNPEPAGEWTDMARNNVAQVVSEKLQTEFDLELVDRKRDDIDDLELSYERLHAAVGNTIVNDYHNEMMRLPSKADTFDWGLGPGVSAVGDRYSADYGLFIYYRDYRASGGRIAISMLAAVAGVAVPLGFQGGFASLVDLRTGEIVWHNLLQAGAGDLRDRDGARRTIDGLLSGLPGA